jgi:hypothetical protein
MKEILRGIVMLVVAVLLGVNGAHAFEFTITDNIKGSLNTTASSGFGIRLNNPSTSLVGDPRYSPNANTAQWSNGDDGNLNYRKGDAYTTYAKLTPELLMLFPEKIKFMARGTLLYDFMAPSTRRSDLSDDAKTQVARDYRLLDLWASKEFDVSGQTARVRVGNQVISWGESIYGIGGINQANALDLQKLMIPGTQLKEAVIPAPMISVASGLGGGFNVEAFYQFGWNRNRVPPVGSYWSVGDIYDKGRTPLYLNATNTNLGGVDGISDPTLANSIAIPILPDRKAADQGQFGVAMHYKPEGTSLDLGLYFMNYHDKMPVLNYLLAGPQWTFLENRQMYGASANFPVGNWAVGLEGSYRPKDAIALTGCFGQGGPLDAQNNFAPVNCPGWSEEKKFQFHLTGLLTLTPGDHGWFLDLVKADGGYITSELVDIYYPNLKQRYERDINGTPVVQAPMAGYYTWLDRSNPSFPITDAAGTKNSLGYTVDFQLVYDGTIIPGWQVIPGCTFTHSVGGDTPTMLANYLEGAMSTNVYILFNMNPAKWQAGINYANYFGGSRDPNRQPWSDRDFFGGFVAYNF